MGTGKYGYALLRANAQVFVCDVCLYVSTSIPSTFDAVGLAVAGVGAGAGPRVD